MISSLWATPWNYPEVFAIPWIDLATLSLGSFFAFLLSKTLHIDRKERGAYIVCGGFSNPA